MSIKVILGDITRVEVDAIVNAANSKLVGGGGVDGAIHRAGGPAIMAECDGIRAGKGGCPTGSAVVTTAGNLAAKYVIHAVGPVWHGGINNEPELLADAYRSSLERATEINAKSVAFPNISTGIYGYPKNEAAEIAIKTVKKYLESHSIPEKIIFVCYDKESFSIYNQILLDK